MESPAEKYKSLFDSIEDQSGTPSIFHWLPTTHVNISEEDLLIDSPVLVVSRRGGLLKQRRCILTRLYLIRFNV